MIALRRLLCVLSVRLGLNLKPYLANFEITKSSFNLRVTQWRNIFEQIILNTLNLAREQFAHFAG